MALTLNQIYQMITVEDDEGDICDTIPDESCTSVPENFFLNAVNGLATKLGDQLASVGLVLPWFLDTLGVSTTVIGMLTPVRRAGALLPQLIVSGQIRQLQKRKWFWVAGGTVFGLSLILMVPAAMVLPATYAGIAILILLTLGSFGRGFSSVAFKDVTGKTIPKGNRGTLMALRATLGGILALIAGFIIRNRFSEQATESITPYLFLVGIGGGLWIISMIPVASLREHPGATEGSRNFFQELKKGYQTLKEIPGFRKFVLNRAVLLSIELSLPFYALYARQATGGNFGALGSFVIAGSLSKIFSSPFWGRFADKSSRATMIISAGLATLAGLLLLSIDTFEVIPINVYMLAIPIIVIGFAIAGSRLGRKTYLIDSAPPAERPLFAAVSNTISGILILFGGGLGLIADYYGIQVLILVLTILYFIGILTSFILPEADNLV